MKIIIDDRETQLFHAVQEIIEKTEMTIEIVKKPICLGDIHFVVDDKEILIIERKSLRDLVSSIKDGRYEEQSYRLIHSSGLFRHHIVYVIEGLFSQLGHPNVKEKKMVYSAMTMLQLYKGFNVIRTYSVIDTAEWILYTADKLSREMVKGSMPWTPESKENTEEPVRYCNVVKKTKKDNITPENIGEIILSQIPSISSVSAIAIMKRFGTITNLIDAIREDSSCLNDIICETKGKSRKIGKNVVENILKFLV
jgi:ERCC4-type nuclease